MPNHTTNILKVNANKKDFEKIKSFMSGEEKFEMEKGKSKKIPFDFNSVIPMPKELINTTSPTNIVSKEEYDKAVRKRNEAIKKGESTIFLFLGLPITKEMSEDYLKRFGSDNWYDWCNKNWGTKWNAYDYGKWKNQSLLFYTAWSPPVPVIKALSEKFPKATFVLQYADEGGGYVGQTTFNKGEDNDTCLTNSDDQEFRDMYCKIRGISEEDAFGEPTE